MAIFNSYVKLPEGKLTIFRIHFVIQIQSLQIWDLHRNCELAFISFSNSDVKQPRPFVMVNAG